ncbi:DEAD/DEAH box helicase [Streptomyces mangrovisoli]|uniref:DEAD/DEAH box helicase n=1 Tax=Streptomyces mangrovisoli TaxID=1428628 RepID=A0A1J4NL20_9ACTN|nr:DEAD/DEAH box helicase [Streptomyces mangrovisoli]OIJ62866.1 DEAD/DEAH box helicase [Streptomyces mangrovisoli]
MERTLDPEVLASALGEYRVGGVLPSAVDLLAAMTELEVAAFRGEREIEDETLGTAWFLHGLAALDPETPGYDAVRVRQAFATSAHLMDLALGDARRPAVERLQIAFAAQAGYRRSEQDPNATAVYRQVRSFIDITGELRLHIGTLAVEAGVVFLGFDRPELGRALRAWRRQLRRVRAVMRRESLAGTMYGPAEAVVEAVFHLYQFLAFGEEGKLRAAQRLLLDVMTQRAGRGDRLARWVAAHLYQLSGEMADSSLYRLLPPDTPLEVARSFALSKPPVMTLWPPQRQLLKLERGNPLDLATSRSLISVPTSAGKTLMAQLVICSHLAQRAGRVVYVSPLRSLGREMRTALRGRLRLLGRRLAAEQPEFPLADWASSAEPDGGDVEIVTPERLMHMIRNNPDAALADVGLVVVDEAHHLGQGRRGLVLESLLTLLQTRSDIRLVLLSAAVGNKGDIASWLDPQRPEREVYFTDTWRGPRRMHGLMYPNLMADQAELTTREATATRPSQVIAAVPVEARLDVRPTASSAIARLTTGAVGTRRYQGRDPRRWNARNALPNGIADYKVFAAGAAELTEHGSVLMVVDTRQRARNAALAIAGRLPERPEAAVLSRYLADTLGTEHPLVRCTRHGVAYHHGALPDDVLHAVEDALRRNELLAITSTSTLTDGVNLPVRTVIVHHKVDGDPLTYDGQRALSPAELLNAIGRAGRAGRESEGWIFLTRPYPPRPAEFDVLNPDPEQLRVASSLLTAEALADLARAEDTLRDDADGIFALADSIAADFASFVWLVLHLHASSARQDGPLDGLDALFALSVPGNGHITSRWLRLADQVAAVYDSTDPAPAGRWAATGTSLGSARYLDWLAQHLAVLLDRHTADNAPGPTGGGWLAEPEEWPLQRTLDFLTEHHVFDRLLKNLPEVTKTWSFKDKETRGTVMTVPIAPALQEWISGASIPALARSWQPGTGAEWALEQAVRNISTTFGHALSWTVGALINLINTHPTLSPSAPRLNTHTAWHIRHGVDTEQALALLTSGITSRRIAHLLGRDAHRLGHRPTGLRQWTAQHHIDGWTEHYQANEYEIQDLLDYVRTPSDPIGQLLDDRAAITPLTRLAPGTHNGPADVAPPSEQHPTIHVHRDGRRVATVPADRHLDVLAMLDSGLELVHHLRNGQLITSRRSR